LETGRQGVAWSPDGKLLAEMNWGDIPTPMRILDFASGKSPELPVAAGMGYLRGAWMSDGRGLVVQYEDNTGPFDQSGFVAYPSGQFHPITKDTSNYNGVAISTDGKMLATVRDKGFFTFYSLPAAGSGAGTPAPMIPQQQRGFMYFSWLGGK